MPKTKAPPVQPLCSGCVYFPDCLLLANALAKDPAFVVTDCTAYTPIPSTNVASAPPQERVSEP